MNIQIVITIQVEGFHNWPEAPSEVSFLADRHRHIFHIKCWKSVSHDDRDIEIILFKREVLNYMNRMYFSSETNSHEFGHRSCEMLASDLIEAYNLHACEVLEDGENGSYVSH
jgi:hypothetical protein